MTERTWQKVAAAALGVVVVGGLLPLFPDPPETNPDLVPRPDHRQWGVGGQ